MDLQLLTRDFHEVPRTVDSLLTVPPPTRWYDPTAYPPAERAWGPRARQFPAPRIPPGVEPIAWMRQRVVAVALRYVGYTYQHHHVPDFNPIGHVWPYWKRVKGGVDGAGADCSNFTSWCYNYGLGIQMNSAIRKQAALTRVEGPNGPLPVQTVLRARTSTAVDYATIVATLQTGDLLYIRGRSSAPAGQDITHVVIWIGAIGRSPDNAPLVIDAHGGAPAIIDANGVAIPSGIQIRPFRKGSWYHTAFDHAHRIIAEQ